MELSNKEKYIKNILEKSDSQLDTDALWDSIEPHIQKRRKERKWAWFLTGMSGVVIALVMLFPIVTNTSSKAPLAKADSTIEKSNRQVNQLEKVSVNARSRDESPESTSNNETVYNTSFDNASTFESTDANVSTRSLSKAITQNQKSSIPVQSDNLSKSDKILKRENRNSINSKDNSLIKTSDAENSTIIISETFIDKSYAELIGATVLELETKKAVPVDRHPEYQISMLFPAEDIEPIITKPLTHDKKIYIDHNFIKPFNPLKWAPFITLQGGINKTNVNSSLMSDDALLNVSEFSKEHGVYGSSYGIQFGLMNTRGLYLGAGLDINSQVVQYRNDDVLLFSNIIDGVETIYTGSNGQSIEINGQIKESVLTEKNVNWFRRHKSFDLQFIAGKELFQLGRVSVSAEAVLSYSLDANHQGYYFRNETDGFQKFESTDVNPYRNSGGFGYRTGLNLNYNLNHITVGLNSYYKYNQNSLTEKNNFYQTKNNQLGIQLGITYKPNWIF